MAADVNIAGPARQLLRVRERRAVLFRVEGIFGDDGPAGAVRLMFGYADNGERLSMTIDQEAWNEMRPRVDRAFVCDLPGQMRLL
jgi:hypothetical protein